MHGCAGVRAGSVHWPQPVIQVRFQCPYSTGWDRIFEVLKQSNVFLVLQRGTELHQLICRSVVYHVVCQEVHQVVREGLDQRICVERVTGDLSLRLCPSTHRLTNSLK